MEIDQKYDPVEVEKGWYDFWLEGGWFEADASSEREPFTIVIPPPNVTGSLHMGHALFVTLQDILVRWRRMQGYEALWLPGTDHAGIATQVQVERLLAREGTDRHSLGREAFLERVWQWKEQYGGRIVEQLKRMGASCDWRRERFTMDEGLSRAVREAFVSLYEGGLIYRAERMVDWDPATQTVLSDLEVDREEEEGSFWYLRYPLADGSGHIVVGTTRPETMLGDAAVAVHPEDERYRAMIGQMIDLPLCDRQIPIITDAILPDPDKGTGAVKVTPAHDPNDFDCGQRHALPLIQVIGLDAHMTDACPPGFRGLDRYEARTRVVAEFEALGLLEKTEPIRYTPGRSERSGVVVEPLPMLQWFVAMGPLAEPALRAVDDGRTRIVPPVWKKTYDHFLTNIRDWCISRQLWWGHRIPAWHCGGCQQITVARQDPERCQHCGSQDLHQDEDVLDTWFSSALWPFSTLGWPERTPSLEKFYPTQVMETGYDILFFWVARMMFMGLHFLGEVPFSQVFLHAMVRDEAGTKMSKMKGNVVDPLHVIYGVDRGELDVEAHRQLLARLDREDRQRLDAQGADALRFTLAILAAQGRDIPLDISRMEGYRAFLNKLWNATNLALKNLQGGLFQPPPYGRTRGPEAVESPVPVEGLSVADRWILARLDEVCGQVTEALETFRFNEAADTLYHFVWHELCDWYVEFIKPALYGDVGEAPQHAARATLVWALECVCRLMHPITPFVTEELWQSLPLGPDRPPSLMIAPWPVPRPALMEQIDAMPARQTVDLVCDLVTQIRAIRGTSNVKPGVVIERVSLICDETARRRLEPGLDYVRRLARVDHLAFPTKPGDEPAATAVVHGVELRIPLKGLIDVEEERARLRKELERVDADLAHVGRKLDNPSFVQKAPDHIVQKERDKKAALLEERAALQKSEEELEALT